MSQRPSSFALRHEPHRIMRTGALSSGARNANLVLAVGEAAFAYALFAPKFFVTKHPVWGTIFALSSLTSLAYAVSD